MAKYSEPVPRTSPGSVILPSSPAEARIPTLQSYQQAPSGPLALGLVRGPETIITPPGLLRRMFSAWWQGKSWRTIFWGQKIENLFRQQTILVKAVRENDLCTAEAALRAGALANGWDSDGLTLLQNVAQNPARNTDLVALLLRYGADITVQNAERKTALELTHEGLLSDIRPCLELYLNIKNVQEPLNKNKLLFLITGVTHQSAESPLKT